MKKIFAILLSAAIAVSSFGTAFATAVPAEASDDIWNAVGGESIYSDTATKMISQAADNDGNLYAVFLSGNSESSADMKNLMLMKYSGSTWERCGNAVSGTAETGIAFYKDSIWVGRMSSGTVSSEDGRLFLYKYNAASAALEEAAEIPTEYCNGFAMAAGEDGIYVTWIDGTDSFSLKLAKYDGGSVTSVSSGITSNTICNTSLSLFMSGSTAYIGDYEQKAGESGACHVVRAVSGTSVTELSAGSPVDGLSDVQVLSKTAVDNIRTAVYADGTGLYAATSDYEMHSGAAFYVARLWKYKTETDSWDQLGSDLENQSSGTISLTGRYGRLYILSGGPDADGIVSTYYPRTSPDILRLGDAAFEKTFSSAALLVNNETVYAAASGDDHLNSAGTASVSYPSMRSHAVPTPVRTLAGDADCSGRVDVNDLQETARQIVGVRTNIDETGLANIDIDSDSNVTVTDLQGIAKIIVGL